MFDNQTTASALQTQQKYASQTVGNCTTSPARDSEAALQRIVQQLEIMNNHSQRVAGVADRLVGSHPKDVGNPTGATAPAIFSSKLHVLADAISRLNGEMADNADRLESFI